MGTLTTDREEALLRGYIPLAKEVLTSLDSGQKIEEIYFHGNGYVTDAILQLIKRKCKSKDVFSGLSLVNLVGSDFITDYGVRCLLDILTDTSSLQEIDLSGCRNVSDSSFALLYELHSKKKLRRSLKGTNVTYLTGTSQCIETQGCPCIQACGSSKVQLRGHVLIVPHPGMKKSLGNYLYDGTTVDSSDGFHRTDTTVGKWNMSITEVASSSNLVDHLTNSLLTQVIIPFEADAEPTEVKNHVMATISKVVAKEQVHCKFPDVKLIKNFKVSTSPWMDIHSLDRLIMKGGPGEGPVLSNVSTNEKSIGVFVSRVPLTRSNSYFEIVLEPLKAKKLAILIGCLYDHLYSDRHPMDSSSDVGGYVDGFEATSEKLVLGFGIEGEWLSEYMPSDDCKYFFSSNGVKSEGKVQNSSADKPRNGMYPLVSILGEEVGDCKLPPLVSPPQELQQKWKREDRWLEKGYTYNCMVDKHGFLRYMPNYETSGPSGFFTGRNELTKENNTFVVELAKFATANGGTTSFKVGIAGEVYKLDKVKDSGLIELAVRIAPYFGDWTCDKCSFQNEGYSEKCVSCGLGVRPKEAVNPTTWKCSECPSANGTQHEQCTSCKKGTKPQGFGEWKQEVFTQINNQIETKVMENLSLLKEGDKISVTMSDMSESSNVTKVLFFHNDKQITFRNFVFSPTKVCRPVPFVMCNEGDVFQLKSFKPTYRRPAPIKDKITLGRANYLNVSDDGTVEYKAQNATARTYGLFVAKTPFSRDLLEMTVEATSLGTSQLFGIGVCDPDYTANSFLGWKQGSVGYHADNGGIYINASTATYDSSKVTRAETIIKSQSKVTIRVCPEDKSKPLRFDDEGHIDSQQVVKLKFAKDDKVIHEVLHEVLGQSIYPAFSLKAGTVKIRNFYAETSELWDKIEGKSDQKWEEEKRATDARQEEKPYCGTEFLVVGVSSGASDVSGKLQIVQQQVDLNEWPELNSVTTAIGDMEKRLGELSLQDQRMYGQLCAVEDNMKLLLANPGRITYHKADLTDKDVRQTLLTKIEDIQDRHKALQGVRYNMSETLMKVQEELLGELQKSKVIRVADLLRATGLEESGTKKEGEEGEFAWMSKYTEIDGNTLQAHLRDLQNKGLLVLIDLGAGLMAVDVGFLLEVEGRMGHLQPTTMMDMSTQVRCIGQTSHVWGNQVFNSKILAAALNTDKMEDMRRVLEGAFAVIRLQCLRTSPDDEQYIYVTQQNLTNPPVSMVEYWNPQMDNTDFVVMMQTYSFPLPQPENLVSLVIANTARYGRILILTGEGVVYQNGAVQTVILGSQDSSGKKTMLIESRCYMPDIVSKEECGMTKQTLSYVQDYTFNIFSTYTDVIDDLFQRSHVITLVTKDWPAEMVNVSIGCKHCWVCSSSGVRQTVCTLCNTCCDKGDNCSWNGIMGDYLRQCSCGTDVDGCNDCGICTQCAEELWAIRSRLRPFSVMMTEVIQSTEEKEAMKSKKDDEKPEERMTEVLQSTEEKQAMKSKKDDEKPEESLALRDPVKQPSIALDPFCFNEVEFTNLSTEEKILCLKEESVGTLLQAYPGAAKMIEDSSTINFKEVYQDKHKLAVGDQIKLKITDPMGVFSKTLEEEGGPTEEALIVEPQYFSLIAREVKVMQETGIIMYDTSSSTIPVGQFVACKPITKENNNFSIRILCKGQKNTIAIGLVPANYPPNRQPGWNAQSIGYHSDDGGIFLESGYPTRKTKVCAEGDIMSLYIDFSKDKGWFRKNGEKCIELNLNPSRLGYYPCIGLHSAGEAVQILEKELWVPATEEDRNRQQPSLPTYKYGNLWISPGKKVTLVKLGALYCGWLVLHNPQKDPVGFKVRSGKSEVDNYFGVLQHKKDWIKNFRIKNNTPDEITVEWSSLESGREYTVDDMKKMFGVGEEYVHQSGHQHRLQVFRQESGNILAELPKVSSGEPLEQSIRLHVYRNLKLVDEYWLKLGNYQVTVESLKKKSNFLLKYPKCPGFNYGKTFQKGMKVIVFLESTAVFAESIVVDVYSGGRMVALEYSPKDKNTNLTICVLSKSSALQFTEFNEKNSIVWRYEVRNTPSNLARTFFSAPPYLLSEGAIKVFNFINKEWKSNVLKVFSTCYQVFTRLTVQEKHICSVSRTPLEWVKNGSSNYLYTFLPSQLSDTSLIYPVAANMYRDISVHRMCFSAEELMTQAGLEEDVAWRIPLHFVDIPGIVPTVPLPPEASFGDGLIVWTYISLISNRLHLPSYKNMIKGDAAGLPRAHVEQHLYSLLQIYSALCSIYSATWGGVEFSQTNEEPTIKDSIRHDTEHIMKFSGKPHTETDMLFRKSGYALCKAHCMAMSVSEDTFPDGVEFDYNYFEPYNDLISMFQWSHTKLSGLPDDFFSKFEYLQYFRIGNPSRTMTRFEKLPEGMSKCKWLKVVEITETAMKELPSDIFLSPSLVSLYCTEMPIKQLPDRWPDTSQVSELVLSGLLLTEVPAGLGTSMGSLERLELCYNPITDLPETLTELKNLKILYLTGAHWLTLEGKKSQMTHEQYETWHLLNPSIRNYFGRERIEELFKEFDFNHNGSLDEEELAALNLKLFFGMPRIGLADINDEVTGGIPRVLFSLVSLNELHLDYCALTTVPQAINNLQNLKLLSLNHNPLLMSLPGSLGHLPNIKGIQINSCPAIRTPPPEVVSRGFESVKAYLKRLAGGYTECRRTKLMVVGLGGAGKTSLLRALMSEKKLTPETESEIPTDGIDIVPWTVASEDGREVTYSTWDFAGQAVYYNTHQFFLSKRAVYLLLWSMRQGYEHGGLDFWLSSICCHAPGTPILIIGTQCDLIPQAEIPVKELRERYPQIASFHNVSSVKGTGIAALQKSLLDVTLQQGYMGEKIPQVWLNFERRILAERLTKKSYIQWEVARQYAMEQGIYDEKDVRLAIQLLHDLGTVQYFDNDFLRDYVVINPQWIVNVMACVVSAQDSPIQKNQGRFLHRDIPKVWQEYDEGLHQWLLRLTEDFDLTFPLPGEAINIVPCLLPSESPEDLHWPKVRGQQGIRETKMVYRFTYLPSGLFNRAQVRLFQFSDGKMIWKKGSMLSKNKHLALIKQTDNKELVVYVQGPRPENIVFLIHEVFESIIDESFNGVHYDMFLPCPDCVLKEGTSDPDLLNAKLIQRAKSMKAPFLQCYKYFHWISMAQLQEKLPADSREVSDFDMQLQQSIVALQELNNDLMSDTAIIYSSKDVPLPGDPNKLPPSLIRDDIVSWGYSCWFADDMDTVSYVDMTAAIKNCKVLIALVSDDFEADTKCCDMFLHAKETMNKDMIIVVVGESLAWQDKDLGIKIGRQERVLMAKSLPRYTVEGGRREELKTWLAEKMALQTRVESQNPDVFVSYAWTNSKEAQHRSGKVHSAGLGYGDPRAIKSTLEGDGVSCWLDIEQVGREKQGIFADMATGIRNSKVILACISDEYAESDNCMMELRFGILNMNLPLVVAVVGTGSTWKETEVAMLVKRARAPEVYLQSENEAGFPTLVKFVKEAMVNAALKKKKKKVDSGAVEKVEQKPTKEEKKAKEQASSIAYKEEYELVQRKFMRHILGSISTMDTLPLPRLMVVDFVKAVAPTKDSDGRESKEGHNRMSSISSSFGSLSKKKLRPKSGRKSRDRLQIDPSVFEDDEKEDWSKESFCLKLMCENEAGWHLCSEMYPLAFRTRDHLETFLKKAAPYLYRIYTLLTQSPIKLKCFAQGKGQAYQDWIRGESELNADFVGAMQHLRTELVKDEAADFLGCLARCRLPSGKILWLCEEHQNQQHVARLSTSSSGGSYSLQKVLFNEDKLFLDNLEKSQEYKALRSRKSTKAAPVLPEPVPIPMFVPVVPPPAPPEEKKPAQNDKKPEKKEDKDKPKDDKQTDKEPKPKARTELRRELSLDRSFGDTDSLRSSSLSPEPSKAKPTAKTELRRQRSRSRSPKAKNLKSPEPNKTELRRQLSMDRIVTPKDSLRKDKRDSSPEPPQAKPTAKTDLRRQRSRSRSPRDSLRRDKRDSSPEPTQTKPTAKTELRRQRSRSRSPRALPSPVQELITKAKDTADGSTPRKQDKAKEKASTNLEKEDQNPDKEAVKKAIKQEVIGSIRRKPSLADDKKKKSSLFTLNTLIQSNAKPNGGISTRSEPAGKSDQLQRRGTSQNFGAIQRGSTVRRQQSNSNVLGKGAQSRISHRSTPQHVSEDLHMSLKINTVGDSSESNASTNSAKSGASGSSKPKVKSPTEKSPLEKVRPRKINVAPKSDRTDGDSRVSKRPSLKATGLAVGSTTDSNMGLPEIDGSKACVLQ